MRITDVEKKLMDVQEKGVIHHQQQVFPGKYEIKKRRHRRPANAIERHYRCPVSSCFKAYG